MKKFLIIFLTLISVIASAQIFIPVEWEFSQKQLSDTEIELQFKANIDDGWHLYSQFIGDDGALPTTFTFFNEGGYKLIDGVAEGQPIEEFDPMYDMVLKYFGDEAIFSQKIKVTSAEDFKLNGDVYFMACNDVKCLPPEAVEFSFTIKGLEEVVIDEALVITEKEAANPAEDKEELEEESSEDNSSNNESMWGLFFLAFLSGCAALLTPCVFPMIPMTVSFFTKQSTTKAKGIANAIIYGISIIVIYVLLGTIVTAFFGSSFLNELATGFWANIFFFVFIMIFAISFLGAFEIQLPASWTNKSVEAEGKGGLIGIFFMAFTLALVSFSCTGPIVGTLLVEAASGGYMGPIIGMLGFSLALALPFALFAAFPGWLNSLPKSGGWLNTVKVFIGFLELALALKFLSMADMAIGGHYIERELFLAIWIGIFLVLALYLFGFIKLPHDTPVKYLSVGRTLLATFTLVFVIYLIPGLWGAPLKLISGFDPPKHNYSESPTGFGGGAMSPQSLTEKSELGPHGIYLFHNNLEEGLRYAKESNKPVLLDFTGINCVNCRRMENKVWGESGVIEILKNELVVISLEVDNHAIKLPKEDQKWVVNVRGEREQLKTIGKKWGHLQASRYKTNTQPYYRMVIPLDGEEYTDIKVGSADYEHHGNSDDFQKWLESAISAYEKVK
jgi:thiol:disulfide interchange protein DsbD